LSSRGQRLCFHAVLNVKTITHPLSLCLLQIVNNRARIPIFPLRTFVFYAYLSPHFLFNHTPSSADCYVLFIPSTCWHKCKQNTTTSRSSDPHVVSPPPIGCCLSDSVANEATVVDAKTSRVNAHESLPLVITHDEKGLAHPSMNDCAGTALPFKWSSASSNETRTDLPRRLNDAGGRVGRMGHLFIWLKVIKKL
jgi:hypothetical protein